MINTVSVLVVGGGPADVTAFTEGISMTAQKICSKLGIGDFPPVWSYLGPDE
jgi:hypothetical protein